MIVTYSLALVAVFIGLCVFFSPAFAYTMQTTINGQLISNVSLLNIAINFSYNKPVIEYEYDSLASIALGATILTLIIMGCCILFITFYKSKTGLKIKRNIFSCALGFILCITDLSIVSSLLGKYSAQGKTIGLAFIFYYLALFSALCLLFGQIIAIILKFKEKFNRQRFDELIEIERSRIPYVKDPYKKELALANLKYMESCNTAPKISKDELESRRQDTLKLMLENPLPEHTHKSKESATCKVGTDK